MTGELAQRTAAVRAWLAALRAYTMVRHGGGAALCDDVTAAVDHARTRIPANVGIVARAKARVRARARA